MALDAARAFRVLDPLLPSAIEVACLIFRQHLPCHGPLQIYTGACWRRELPPFSCDSAGLSRFVADYDDDGFFSWDVVILCEASRTMTVFHHGGGYAHVRL